MSPLQEWVRGAEWGRLQELVLEWEAFHSTGRLPVNGRLKPLTVELLPHSHLGLAMVSVMLYVYQEVAHRQAQALAEAKKRLGEYAERVQELEAKGRPVSSERWQS